MIEITPFGKSFFDTCCYSSKRELGLDWLAFVHTISTKEDAMENKYEITVPSTDAIDFYELEFDVDRINPVALVDAGEHGQFAVVHRYLIDKADNCEIPMPDYFEWFKLNQVVVFKLMDVEDFADIVSWAKRVKKAKWPNGKKQKVKISFPSI